LKVDEFMTTTPDLSAAANLIQLKVDDEVTTTPDPLVDVTEL
jgi:hypothetical protein